LDRKQAIDTLKKVLETCPSINGYYIALMTNPDSASSHSYQIHLKTTLSPKDRQCLQDLLSKEGLAFKETKDTTIIYKPR